MKRLILAILVIGILLLSACGAPAIAPVSEPAIPAHFTTYTDELGLFSISYPPKWELALSKIEGEEQFIKELMESIESGLPLERVSVIFFAEVPTETGYSPNVNIVVESFPGFGWTLDKLVEANIQTLKDFVEDYHEFSRVKTTIGGREAVIIDWEGTFPYLVKSRGLQMVTLVGKVGWYVTCKTSPEKFSDFEDDFYAIVRSLRILK